MAFSGSYRDLADKPDFATQEYVSQKIAESQLEGSDVDLSAYYTKSETEDAIRAAQPDLSGYATQKQIEYIAGELDKIDDDVLTEVAKVGYQTEAQVLGLIEANGGNVDLTDYYTKNEVNIAIRNAVPNVDNFLLKSQLPTKVSAFTNDAGYQNASQVNSKIKSIFTFNSSTGRLDINI